MGIRSELEVFVVRRLVPFMVVLGVCFYLCWQAFEGLGFTVEWKSFGFAMGVAALTGFIWFMASRWWSAMVRPYKPQSTSANTRETPNQIGCAGVVAALKLLMLLVVIIAVMVWMLVGFGR